MTDYLLAAILAVLLIHELPVWWRVTRGYYSWLRKRLRQWRRTCQVG